MTRSKRLDPTPPSKPIDNELVVMLQHLEHDLNFTHAGLLMGQETTVLAAMINYRAAQLIAGKLDDISMQLSNLNENISMQLSNLNENIWRSRQ